MDAKTSEKKYMDHFEFRETEINLPFKKPTLIFSYYNLEGEENKPLKTATCNVCEKKLGIIKGGSVNSSFTFNLTFHLQNGTIIFVILQRKVFLTLRLSMNITRR